MKVKQLSIFVENKSGRLAEITTLLSDAEIDIRAISVADTSDFGILRLIVDDPDKAVKVLKKASLTVSLTEVIAIGIDDTAGRFSEVLRLLCGNGIGVEYTYAFITPKSGMAYIILRVDDDERAVKLLLENNIKILSCEEIQSM